MFNKKHCFTVLKRIVIVSLLFCFSGVGTVLSCAAESTALSTAERELKASTEISDVYNDQAYIYISDIEPSVKDSVTIKLRTEKFNITSAQLLYSNNGGSTWSTSDMTLIGDDQTGYYELWEGEIPPQANKYHYCFKVTNNFEYQYYCPRGFYKQIPITNNCFEVIPDFKTPDWAKGANWYFINPDAFYNGNIKNDGLSTGNLKNVSWNSNIQGLTERYGGDLEGITAKADYFSDLYVDAIYLNPVWDTQNNICYGPSSYYKVSSYLGNEKDLQDMINTMHNSNIKVMLDAVFSYSQNDSVWFNKGNVNPLEGAYQNQNNPLAEMFDFTSWPNEYEIVWGNARLNLSAPIAKKLLYSENDSVIKRYLAEPYNIDGWRFDSVSSFFTGEQAKEEIYSEIRDSIKSSNPEALMIAEDRIKDILSSGEWDSSYGIRGYFRRWFSGEYNQTLFKRNLLDYLTITRSTALCNINMYDLHDENRITNDTSADAVRLRALQLFLMTFLGSPATYYGDEVGVLNNAENGFGAQKWNTFDWDESRWDMNLYNTQKALGALRREYTALKTGAMRFGLCDDDNQIMTIGRFDQNGAVITVTNQTSNTYNKAIDVKQFNVKDGTKLTDYLSGKEYTVENGFVNIDIYAGGCVLVTAEASKQFRDDYEIYNIGENNSTVIKTSENEFTVTSQGKIGDTSDEMSFTAKTVFGAHSLISDVSSVSDGALMFRASSASSSAFYGVTVKNKLLSIWYRSEDSASAERIFGISLPQNALVKIERNADNEFSVSYSKTGSSTNWQKLEQSEVYLQMPQKTLVGVASCSGTNIFNSLTVDKLADNKYCSFEESGFGADFTLAGENFEVSDGCLKINSSNQVVLSSYAPKNDYTFKAKIGAKVSSVNKLCAVTAMSNDDNFVFISRSFYNNKNVLALGKVLNGKIIIQSTVEDIYPDKDCVLQLQKQGTYFTASYTYDETYWQTLDGEIYANYPDEKAGVYISAGVLATVDYVSFGDSINDKVTISTPKSVRDVTTDFRASRDNRILPCVSVIGNANEWYYTTGGIARHQASGLSQLAVANRKFSNFKITATLKPISSNSEVGITFLRVSCANEKGRQYVLSLTKSGVLSLSYKNSTIWSKRVSITDNGLPVQIERINEKLWVYYGEKLENVETISDVTLASGYVTYYVNNGAGAIYNDNINSIDTDWSDINGIYSSDFNYNSSTNISVTSSKLAFANIVADSFTDVLVSGKVTLNTVNQNEKAYAGFLIGGNYGLLPEKSGAVIVALNSDGSVSVSRNGLLLATTAPNYSSSVAMIEVVRKNSKLYVVVDGKITPELSVNLGAIDGGTVGICSYNSKGSFDGISAKDMSNSEIAPEYNAQLDRLFSENMTVKTGVYDEVTDTFSSFGASSTAMLKADIKEDNACLSFTALTMGEYLEIPYKTDKAGYLSLRIYSTSAVLLQNGVAISNWKSFDNAISLSSENNYTISVSSDKTSLWINGELVSDLTYNSIPQGFDDFSFGIYFPLTYGKSAKAYNIKLWGEEQTLSGHPECDSNDVDYTASKTVTVNSVGDKIILSDYFQSAIFESGIESGLNQAVSFEIKTDSNYFDLITAADSTNVYAIRFYEDKLLFLKNNNVIKSFELSKFGVMNMNFENTNKLTLKKNEEGIAIWINSVALVGLPNINEGVDNFKLGIFVPLNYGQSAEISNMNIWQSADIKSDFNRPLYNEKTDYALNFTEASSQSEICFTVDYFKGIPQDIIIRKDSQNCLSLRVNDDTLKLIYNGNVIYSETNKLTDSSALISVRVTENLLAVWVNGELALVYDGLSQYSNIPFAEELFNNDVFAFAENAARYVSFCNEDGILILKVKVLYGQTAKISESHIPQKAGYDFAGWNMDLTAVTEDITVKAIYIVSEEPVYNEDYDIIYSKNVYDGYRYLNKEKNSFTLSNETKTSSFINTGLASEESYNMSFTFSNVTADCINISYRSGNNGYIALRIYKNEFVVVNAAGNKTYSDWIRFSKLGLPNIDLTATNHITLVSSMNGIKFWINGKKVEVTYNSNYVAGDFDNVYPGVYVYQNFSAQISDLTVWVDGPVISNSRPVYSAEYDTLYSPLGGDSVEIKNSSTSNVTVLSGYQFEDNLDYCLSFDITPTQHISNHFIQLNLKSFAGDYLAFRIYKTQCLLVNKNGAITNWLQFAKVGLSHISNNWGSKFSLTVKCCNGDLEFWIDGIKVTGLIIKDGISVSDYTTPDISFVTNGCDALLENIYAFRQNSNLIDIKFDFGNDSIETLSVVKGNQIILPILPKISNYNSLGWQNSLDGLFYSQGQACLAVLPVTYTAKYILQGDLNNDAKLSAIDLILMKKYLLGINCDIFDTALDTNDDKKCDILDLIHQKRQLLKEAS